MLSKCPSQKMSFNKMQDLLRSFPKGAVLQSIYKQIKVFALTRGANSASVEILHPNQFLHFITFLKKKQHIQLLQLGKDQ